MALQRVGSSPRLRGELFGARGERTLVLLQAAWPWAVGDELARRTEVVALDAGTLRVRVPDAGWRKVLHRMRGDILKRLYDVAGEFAPRRMGFMEGPLASTSTSGRPEALPPATPLPVPATASPSLRKAAEAIDDPDLRQRFLETAALYLGRASKS